MRRTDQNRVLVSLGCLAISLVAGQGALGQEGGGGPGRSVLVLEHLSFNPSRERFVFRGRAERLPDGTRIVAVLSLGGSEAASAIPEVVRGAFEGEFPTSGKRVLPGVYELTLVVAKRDQPGRVQDAFPPGLEADRMVKEYEWQGWNAARELAVLREAAALQTRRLRGDYDRMAGLGRRVLDPRATGGDAVGAWGEYLEGTEGWLGEQASAFRASHREGVFASPITTLVDEVLELHECLAALRTSYGAAIEAVLEGSPDSPAESPLRIHARVNALAWRIERELIRGGHLGGVEAWAPRIEMGREVGRWEGSRWVSETSGFVIERPGERWAWVPGESDSTMRFSLDLATRKGVVLATAQVHMLEFPWANSREELARSWECLAEYEWEGYERIEGRFVRDPGAEREYYLFRFHTRSEFLSTIVDCRLLFHSAPERSRVVYGLLVASFYEGEADRPYGEDLERIRSSFALVE